MEGSATNVEVTGPKQWPQQKCAYLIHFLCTQQTIDDFASSLDEKDTDKESTLAIVKAGITKKSLSVSIERDAITIRVPSLTHEVGEECHELPLEYFVIPGESYWRLEALYTREEIVYPLSDQNVKNCSGYKGRKELPFSHLILHLSKALSVEWFPGCEWWSSVFIGDEEIDTSTCTVGTDTSELSKEAWLRAQKEHARFSDQSVEERENELQGVSTTEERGDRSCAKVTKRTKSKL